MNMDTLWIVLLAYRQFYDKGGALARPLALGMDGAAVRLHDILRDIETVAGGVDVYLLRLLAVPALGEKPLLVLVGNADT